MSIQDENLLAEFLAESREHLSSIEPDLLILEKETQNIDQETINKIFRAIHSIKGAAGFFGFETLKRLSHVMENSLMQIRSGKLIPTSEVVDKLLAAVDKLNSLIDDIHVSEQVNCDAEITELSLLIDQPSSDNLAEALQESVVPDIKQLANFTVEPEKIKKWQAQGKHVYELCLYIPTSEDERVLLDNLLRSLGTIVTQDGLESILGFSDGKNKFFYVTVLDQELLAVSLNITEQDIKSLESDTGESSTKSITQSFQELDPKKVCEENQPQYNLQKAEKSSNTEAIDTIRVRVDLLNTLMNLVGEMVLIRNQLSRALKDDVGHIEGLSPIMQNLDLATSDLQEHIMQTRMQPIGNIMGKLPRMVRDLARKLDKEINIEVFGEEVELDKSLLEVLSDPLNHLIRNCCDHGIEHPEERIKANKGRTGTITIRAYHEGGQIHISILDDGKGINSAWVSEKALKMGLITQSEVDSMNARELNNLIFLPGLSTAEKVSDVSGRGVGMDVVKTNIEKLGGHISLDSEQGMGTSILLRLPLTLAIIPSLIVSVQDYRFAISQVNLVELICIRAKEISQRIERVGSATVLRLREKLLPLVRLADVLGIERQYYDPGDSKPLPDRRLAIDDLRLNDEEVDRLACAQSTEERRIQPNSDYFVVVLQVGNHQYGLIVDDVLDLEEIVVKPLSAYLKQCQCFSGATIMGDGRVAMILDAAGIMAAEKMSFSDISAEEQRNKKAQTQSHQTQKESLLLFNNDMQETFAIPLSSILRLEKFNPDNIETIGRKEFIVYCGNALPLVRLEEYLPVRPGPAKLEEAYVIIPKCNSANNFAVAGIVASRILDAIDAEILADNEYKNNTIYTTSIIQNHMTMVLNTEALLKESGYTTVKESAHV